jgi:hypothetical protein
MYRLPTIKIGRIGLLVVLVSKCGCLLPDFDGIVSKKPTISLQEIEADILALELHGKDLQQAAAILAQRGYQNGGRYDQDLNFRRTPGAEVVHFGRCDHVVFSKQESEGFGVIRSIGVYCILNENDRVKDLLFSEVFTGL